MVSKNKIQLCIQKKLLKNNTTKSHEKEGKKTPKKKMYPDISPTHNMTSLLGMSSSNSDSKSGVLSIASGLWVLDCILLQ